jgi:hypothetical protein
MTPDSIDHTQSLIILRNQVGQTIIEIYDTMSWFNGVTFENDIISRVIIANGSVTILEMVESNTGRQDVLVNANQVGLVRVEADTEA